MRRTLAAHAALDLGGVAARSRGPRVGQPSSPIPPSRPGGYADLAAEIRGLGLMRRRPGFYAVLFAGMLLALGASPPWMAAAPRLLVGAAARAGARGGLHPARASSATTRRTARSPAASGPAGGSRWSPANLLNGLSYGWWLDKHNAHHAHPNDLESDPDVYAGAVVFDAGQAVGRRGVAGWATRHQAWLYVPMLIFEGLNLHVSSVRAVLRPGLRHRRVEVVLLACTYAAYVGAARRHADLAAGARLRGRAPGGVRRLPRDVVRAGAQGDAGARRPSRPPTRCCARCSPRATCAAGGSVSGGARRAQLPDRAPPVPEHAAAAPAAGAAGGPSVLRRARRRLRRGVRGHDVPAVLRHLDAVGADLRGARR